MKKVGLIMLVLVCFFSFSSGVFAKDGMSNRSKIEWMTKSSNVTADPVYFSLGYGPDGEEYNFFCYAENMLKGRKVQFFVNGDYVGKISSPKTKIPKKGNSQIAFLKKESTVGKRILITEPGEYHLDFKVFYPAGETDCISYTVYVNPFNIWTSNSFQDSDDPNIYIIDKRLTHGERAYFYESIKHLGDQLL